MPVAWHYTPKRCLAGASTMARGSTWNAVGYSDSHKSRNSIRCSANRKVFKSNTGQSVRWILSTEASFMKGWNASGTTAGRTMVWPKWVKIPLVLSVSCFWCCTKFWAGTAAGYWSLIYLCGYHEQMGHRLETRFVVYLWITTVDCRKSCSRTVSGLWKPVREPIRGRPEVENGRLRSVKA